ncbi:putative A_deaminase domain-containing protein [Azospirillaceae bacterium]
MSIIYRQLLRQTRIMHDYLQGAPPNIDRIRFDLFISERERNTKRPDHYLKQVGRLQIDGDRSVNNYKSANKPKSINDYKNLNELLVGVFSHLADDYLVCAGHEHVCVRKERFEQWQNLITDFPPLLLVVYRLHMEYSLTEWLKDRAPDHRGLSHIEVKSYIDKIRPQLRYSAIPTIQDPRLDYLIRTYGLDEMHMHLNGSTEVESVWLDALRSPGAFAEKFRMSESNSEVEELLKQEDYTLNHKTLLDRLRVARALREWLAHEVLLPLAKPTAIENRNRKTSCVMDLIRRAHVGCALNPHHSNLNGWCDVDTSQHEVVRMWPRLGAILEPLAQEAFLIAALFHALETEKSDALAHAAYAYLLIMAQFSRLLVQQGEQWGFDQFQKITVNEMREMTERDYKNRFYQLSYTREGDLDTLEGRFAPKSSQEGNKKILKSILHGYLRFFNPEIKGPLSLSEVLEKLKDIKPNPAFLPRRKPKLILVAHFIKKKDKYDSGDALRYRHKGLRNEIEKTAIALMSAFDEHPLLRRYVTGIDGAANELHAPPEVFAPVFRYLRRRRFPHFTFHAGEDFVHLLSGVRAVYEVLMLLGMTVGNRVGHATALGIEPDLWRHRMGESIVVNRGERLDDLVIARHLLTRCLKTESVSLLKLDQEISCLSQEVYGREVSSAILYEAWGFRRLDPSYAFEARPDRNTEGWSKDDREERELVEKAKLRKEAYQLFCEYHGNNARETVERYNQPIQIDLENEPLDNVLLRRLQDVVLEELRTRQIAIESLPTSNIRISVYEKYAEHHVFRWLGLQGDPPVQVCLGSDDPGIFSTNLRNEYAHLLCELDKRVDMERAQKYLEKMIVAGKTYRFNPVTDLPQ